MESLLRPIKDVSIRILRLSYFTQESIERFRAIEEMADPNARDRTNVLNKRNIFLDDDCEDIMFSLEWAYYRSFAPAAFVHRKSVDLKMKRLRGELERWGQDAPL